MDFYLAAAACDYKLCWYKNTREFFRFMLNIFSKFLKAKNQNSKNLKFLKFLKFQNFRSERKTS